MRILFVIPGDIDLPTGGYRYDRHIILEWRKSRQEVDLISLEGNYPFPTDEEKANALKAIEHFPPAEIAVVDGLLGGASPEFLKKLADKMPVVSLLHHPLCLENGLSEQVAKELKESEKSGLAWVKAVITTSETTSQTVKDLFKFAPERIHAVLPGVDRPANRAANTPDNDSNTVKLICVASVIPRKSHRTLLEALAELRNLDWVLNCYGSTQFDEALFLNLKEFIEKNSLTDKVAFHGAVEDKTIEEAYASSDIFVLPSQYEGYGMVYAEAIVRGLPVIGTTGGAIAKTVPPSCGILIEPENTRQLKQALEKLITDKSLRLEYKENTIRAEPEFPTWQTAAQQFAKRLKELA
jgi:glycosyltransferase involved in cell wall biosynthesis